MILGNLMISRAVVKEELVKDLCHEVAKGDFQNSWKNASNSWQNTLDIFANKSPITKNATRAALNSSFNSINEIISCWTVNIGIFLAISFKFAFRYI